MTDTNEEIKKKNTETEIQEEELEKVQGGSVIRPTIRSQSNNSTSNSTDKEVSPFFI